MARQRPGNYITKPTHVKTGPAPFVPTKPQTILQQRVKRLLEKAKVESAVDLAYWSEYKGALNEDQESIDKVNLYRATGMQRLADIANSKPVLEANYLRQKVAYDKRKTLYNEAVNKNKARMEAYLDRLSKVANVSNFTPTQPKEKPYIDHVVTEVWPDEMHGFRRIKKGVHEGQGIYQTEQGFRYMMGGKPTKKKVTLANGKTATVYDSHLGIPLGYHGAVPMAELVDDKGSAEQLIDKVFDGKHKTYSVEMRSGHILALEYSAYFQLLKVTFWNEAEVVYFRVPSGVFGELYHLAKSGAVRIDQKGKERHMVGIRFWDLVRVRGTITGSRYRYTYYKEGDPTAGRTGSERGRPKIYMEDGITPKYTKMNVAGMEGRTPHAANVFRNRAEIARKAGDFDKANMWEEKAKQAEAEFIVKAKPRYIETSKLEDERVPTTTSATKTMTAAPQQLARTENESDAFTAIDLDDMMEYTPVSAKIKDFYDKMSPDDYKELFNMLQHENLIDSDAVFAEEN